MSTEVMTGADAIREFCIKEYVEPARDSNEYTVTIRSGDVHTRMQLSQRLPGVCGALGSDTFEKAARVRRLVIDGPLNGASTLFVFALR